MWTHFCAEINAQNVFTYSYEAILKVGTALLIGPVENCLISSPVRFLIHKLFLAFAPRPWYLHGILKSYGLFNHLRTVLIEAILRYVRCAQSLYASRWICRSVSQQSVALFNELRKQKLQTTPITVCNNIATKITPQWRRCRVKLALIFVEIDEEEDFA